MTYNFPVSESALRDLERRMEALQLREADIEESFIHSSGPGGQNVNKVSTCVVLLHLPTGTVVRCQRERSQALNRFLARRLLVERIETRVLGARSESEKRIWKIRKQKARRSRKAKAKILEEKRRQSSKKSLRATLRPGKDY